MALVSLSSQRRSPTTHRRRAAKFRPARTLASTPGEAQRSAVVKCRDAEGEKDEGRVGESERERERVRESGREQERERVGRGLVEKNAGVQSKVCRRR